MTETTPRMTVGQVIVPEGYMRTDREQRLLDWSYIDERMTAALNYWVATTRPSGHPHVAPTWGVWDSEHFYFDGSPETRRMKNIAANPHVVIHLEDGDKAVIVEGIARTHERPTPAFAERLAALYTRKYTASDYAPTPDTWDNGGLYVVQPTLVLAWTEFGVDMTRWRIQRAD
jgi:nitroimidazol reductase NimA-like FMN-containing flavoprotein (pyridoxamine 5'-phosphate oxidase superfamily)